METWIQWITKASRAQSPGPCPNDRAKRVLTDHRGAATAIAERLLAIESLDAPEINQVLTQHGIQNSRMLQ